MPFVPVGYAEIALVFQFDGDSEDMLTTFGVEVSGSITSVDLGDICEGFQAAFEEDLATQLNLVGARATIGQDGDDITVEVAGLDLNFTGGTSLPPNSALLIRKLTGLGGRKNRGRMYIPGVRAASVTPAGVLGSGAQTDLQEAAVEFMAAILTVTTVDNVVVLHTRHADTPTVITDFIVDPRIATQRRRLRP